MAHFYKPLHVASTMQEIESKRKMNMTFGGRCYVNHA